MGTLPAHGYTGGNVALGIQFVRQIVSGFLEDSHEDSTYGWLGVTPTPKEVGRALGDPIAGGTRVQFVAAGSPADRAGIVGGNRVKAVKGELYVVGGDVIVALEGRPVSSDQDLIRTIGKLRPGDTTSVTLLRGGSRVIVEATLAARPSLTQ
jgi:S1-C subfamily serine protease